jgi:hypothetical protein
VAGRLPELAAAGRIPALGAFYRLAIDIDVLDRVARRPPVTAEHRILLRVLHEMHDRRLLDKPRPAAGRATNVNHATLKYDCVLHTPPARAVGTVVPFHVRTGWPAASRINLVVPARMPFKQVTRPCGARVLAAATELYLFPGDYSMTARTVKGMARVRSGQAVAWPLVSDRSARRGSRVKRDFACTVTRHLLPVRVVLRSQSCLRLEGRARTLSGPSPDLSPARAPALPPAAKTPLM